MKTPEQWLEEFPSTMPVSLDGKVIKLIQAIQKDAVEHCARLVHDLSRGTKSTDRAMAIDEARDLLLDESKP